MNRINIARFKNRLPLLMIAIGITTLVAACSQDVAQPTNLPSTPVPSTQVPSSTPRIYITPTPEYGLPGEDVILEQAVVAGTATRAAQLTFVPTWPPNVPRPYPSQSPSTPIAIAIPSQVAGDGIIYNADLVGVGVGLDLSSQIGLFMNEWDTQVNEQYIEVFAGTKSSPSPSERAKGIVVVRVSDGQHNRLSLDVYETPLGDGAVRITDAVGERLTVRSENGTFFYFDLATRQWVNAPPAPSPVPSLLPTP